MTPLPRPRPGKRDWRKMFGQASWHLHLELVHAAGEGEFLEGRRGRRRVLGGAELVLRMAGPMMLPPVSLAMAKLTQPAAVAAPGSGVVGLAASDLS